VVTGLIDPAVLATLTAGTLAVTAVGVLVRERVWLWRHRRFADAARWVNIAPPPTVEPASAAALWTTLSGVLAPARWTRLRYGTAHVAWEYTWSARVLTIRIWVPGTVPPGAVEAAVTAAWPGATITTEPAADPIPTTLAEPTRRAESGDAEAGGALWPHHGDVLPLRVDHDVDPLRALLASGGGVRNREHACLQVLARPATARRVARARRTVAAAAGGRSPDPVARLVGGLAWTLVQPVIWLTEVFLPGPGSRGRSGQPATARPEVRRDPVEQVRLRAAGEKAARVPHYEIAVRYAVTTTSGSARADGLAHTLASSAATYTRPNRLRRMRTAHPVAVLAETLRALRPGGRAVVFDKFAPDDRAPSRTRRALNVVTAIFGTEIDRRLAELVAGAPCRVVSNEASILGGQYHVVLLTRTDGP